MLGKGLCMPHCLCTKDRQFSYNSAAESFHIQKLCSRLSFLSSAFWLFGELRGYGHASPQDHWKARQQLPNSDNCFLLAVMAEALLANIWLWLKRWVTTRIFSQCIVIHLSILPRISFVHAPRFFQRPGAIQAIYLLTYLLNYGPKF